MLNGLYVKETDDTIWTKIVAVLLIEGVPTYVDAYGEQYIVGEADVMDINRHVDSNLELDWLGLGVSFTTYTRNQTY